MHNEIVVNRGSGRPLVCLHGLFGGPEDWEPTARYLGDAVRTIALRLPFDGSVPEADSIPAFAEYVRVSLDRIGIERAALCGNSLGGQIALAFALRHPERVSALVLAGSAGLFEASITGGAHPRATAEFIRDRAREVFYDPAHVTDDMVERVRAMVSDRPTALYLLKVARSSRATNVRDALPGLEIPTLIVWGANDRITPPHVGEEFQRLIAGSRLALVDACGHAPQIERPEAFATLVRRFMVEEALAAS